MAETKKTEKIATIPEKLAEIAKLVDVMKKDTASFVANYVNEESILERITLGLKQQKLEIYPMIVPGTLKTAEQNYVTKKTLKDGTVKETPVHETIVSCDMNMRWINLENTEEVLDIPWAMVGQQSDVSQAFGSALTYCMRYFYLKFFHVATTKDDPDNFRAAQAQIESDQNKATLKAITDELNELVISFIGKDKDKEKKEKIVNFLKDNNNNDADYTKIKDIEIANNLKIKVKNFIMGKKEE
jgi:hypothetical protein